MDNGTGKKSPHILILEDDRSHQDLALRAFRDDPEPFRISLAGTISQARQILKQDPPDLIIADWILPDGKGLEILPRTGGVVTSPLVIMTSHGDEHLAVEILKSGAIDYVVKSATTFKALPTIARHALRDWDNIRQRERAEEAERDARKRLADIISFMPDAILAIDNNGRVIAWNKAIEEMTGVAAADMLGKGDHEYSIPFYGVRRPILIDLVLSEDTEIEKKYDFLQKDGEKITFETFIPTLFDGKGAYLWGTASPLYGTTGEKVGAIETIRDITDRKRDEVKLRRHDATLETLLNAPHDTIALLDRQGIILNINREGARRLGGTVQEITGKCAYDLLPPDSARERRTYVEKVFESGEPASLDDARSGKYLHNEIFPIFNPEHTAADHVAVFARDITERIHAERVLQESETRFRDLFNNMGAGVAIYEVADNGEDFILKDINRAAERIDQIRKDEIVGRNILEVFPGIKDFGLFDVLRRVARTGTAESHPAALYRDNRIEGWRENYVYKLPSGEVVAIYEDITERKQAEDETRRLVNAIKEEKEKLSALVNSITDEVWFTDTLHRFTLVNPQAQQEFGLPLTSGTDVETLVKDLEVLRPDGTPRPLEEAPPLRALAGEIVKNMEEIVRTPLHGEMRYRQVSAAPVKDPSGAIIGAVSVVRDITDQKQADEKLRKSEEKFRTLFENMMEGFAYCRMLYDEEGRPEDFIYLDVNAAFHRITGTTMIVNKRITEEFPGIREEIPEIFEIYGRVARTGTPEVFDLDFKRIGKWLHISVFSPKKEHFVAVFEDITERKYAEAALHTTETRFRALIQNSSDIIRILDREGRIVYESASAERILGYPPGFMIGNYSPDYIHPEDLDRVKTDLEAVYTHTNPGTPTEFRIRRADGTYIWVDSIGTNLLDVDGVNGIVVTTRPIQQRKEAEEQIRTTLRQLERSEALLRKVYDILPIGLWLADKNGTLSYGNPAGVKIWGAEPHVPLEKYGVFKARRYPSGEEIAPEDWALVHTIQKGVTIKDEMLEIDAFDGKKKIILNYTAPLYDAEGVLDGAIVVNQEITDRVKAEQDLLENQARLASAMDIAGLVNWEFDVASGMFHFDDRFYSLYETSADREGGNLMSAETYMQEFVYPEDRPAVLASIRKILATTDPDYHAQVEHRITPRDGSIRTIVARFVPVFSPDGKVIRTMGANQDITDFKLMESEIRSLNAVLEQRVKDRTEALTKANDALEEENAQRLEAERRLQSSYDEKVLLLKEIHHRVKNNLQIIASLLNLQSRYITDEQTLAAIRESQNRVKAMALVHEKLYRAEDIAHISLHDYIKFLGTGLFQFYDARSRGIEFTLDIRDIDVDINTAIPLGLIINELISNSLKYAFPEGRKGEVSISVKKEDHTITVLFRDTGIGIPADLDWENTPSLGLRLVTTLVDQMSGTAHLDRSSGTQFTLVLHEKEERGPE
jgi:PAS domain S-box-containing protein